jgi:molecular chaperone DnaJ
VASLYEVLGVDQGASEDEVKKAYRAIASRTHPDKNPGDKASEDRFKEATRAYETLSDRERRVAYDSALNDMRGFRQSAVPDPFVHDFMKDFFGPFSPRAREAGRRPQRAVQGQDTTADVSISFAESMRGARKEVRSGHGRKCAVCRGSGTQKGTRSVSCGTCSGAGQVPEFSSLRQKECPACRGRRSTALTPCGACSGSGVDPSGAVTVIIPAGIDDGQVLRVQGQGEPGEPPGDLYVTVGVERGVGMARSGLDLVMAVEVPLRTMSRGGSVAFESPFGGEATVDVSPGTRSGTDGRVRGGGFPSPSGGPRGDLVVRLDAEVPAAVSPRAEKLLDELLDELERSARR